jgi:uncharacterized protein (DUF433 family)
MSVFLKVIGSANDPWVGFYDKKYVDFSRRPNEIQPDDFLILYAAGGLKRVFAVAQVKGPVYQAEIDVHPRWPYRMDIEYLVNVPATEGVHIYELMAGRNLINVIKANSYFKLRAEEYEQALDKLKGALEEKIRASDVPHLLDAEGSSALRTYNGRGQVIRLPVSTGPVPLESTPKGTIRLRDTRVSLDSVIYSFKKGSTPEEIVQQYTSLDLPDVYTVISYYLRNREQVEEYLKTNHQEGESLRREIESQFDPNGIRERLLARSRRTA